MRERVFSGCSLIFNALRVHFSQKLQNEPSPAIQQIKVFLLIFWCINFHALEIVRAIQHVFYFAQERSNAIPYALIIDKNGLVQIEQLVELLYSLHCSWVSRFMGILLARCCLQIVAAARTQSKNFSAVPSPIFTSGGSQYLLTTACHLDVAPTWYMMLVLGGEGF